MPHEFNPDMLVVAREARGVTQTELANRIDVAQGTISKYEGGLLGVVEKDVEAISSELQFPVEFFYQTDRVYGFGSSCFYHRKRQKMPVVQLRQLQARLNVFRFQVARLLRGIDVATENEFIRLDTPDDGSPEDIARAMRAAWKLPMGPVRNVIASVENAGAIVYELPFGSMHIDAISQVSPGCPPIIFVNRDIPADRLRFTLMHEVAHLVMHHVPCDDMESQADRFAAEFLMPAHEISSSLRKLSLQKLTLLKEEWLVSMNALLKRAGDLDKITERHSRTLWTRMSKQGWRTKEPVDIPREKPLVFKSILEVHLHDHGYNMEELAQLANADKERFAMHLKAEENPTGGLRIVG